MSLPNYLAKIKSSGVYRYVFDKSEIPAADRESIRLIVGYSEKGPFNTPVYISDASDFIATFGGISRRMERKGIFFHRLALQALEAGPILALNLKPFNQDKNNPEKSSVYAFNASDVKTQLIPVTDYETVKNQTFRAISKSNYDLLSQGTSWTIMDNDEEDTIWGPDNHDTGSKLRTAKFGNDISDAISKIDTTNWGSRITLAQSKLKATQQEVYEYQLGDGSHVNLTATPSEVGADADNVLPAHYIKTMPVTASADVNTGYAYEIILDTKTGNYWNVAEVTTVSRDAIAPILDNLTIFNKTDNSYISWEDYFVHKYQATKKDTSGLKYTSYVLYDTVGTLSLDGASFGFDDHVFEDYDEIEYYNCAITATNPQLYCGYDEVWHEASYSAYACFGLKGTERTFLGFGAQAPFSGGPGDPDWIIEPIYSGIFGDLNDKLYDPDHYDFTTEEYSGELVHEWLKLPEVWCYDVLVFENDVSEPQKFGNYIIDDRAGVFNNLNLYHTIDIAALQSAYVAIEAAAVEGETIHTQAGLANIANVEIETEGDPLASIYDTNRFWKVDANRLHEINVTWNTPADQVAENDYVRIVNTSSLEDSSTVFIRPYVPTNWNVTISDWYSADTTEDMPPYLEAIKDHYLSEFFVDIYVFGGDMRKQDLFAETGTLGMYNSRGIWQPFCYILNDAHGDKYIATNQSVVNSYGDPIDVLETMAETSTSNFIGRYTGIMFPNFKDSTGTFIDIASVFNSDYETHKLLLHLDETLLDAASDYDYDSDGDYDEPVPYHGGSFDGDVSSYVHALCSAVVAGDHSLIDPETGRPAYPEYDPTGKAVAGIYMKGYTYYSVQKADRGGDPCQKIIKVLSYKGLREALTNNVDVDYKYLVDTFQGYAGVNMKSEFSTIAKAKFNTLALVNFPPINDIIKKFGWGKYDGTFDMSKITKNRFNISLPAESQGASWTAFYTQLQMTDGSSKFIVPSAALVSNLYMEKRAKRLPYYIVAGPNYGRIVASGVIGPDYNYSRTDLDVLEPFGVNAIIYIPRKGTVINSNQTAKQTPVTALSKIHVRELVTFIQDEVENMLYNYQWELNTSTLRDAIRTKAETILGLVQANGGIYDYRVQCDAQNNTPEVIDNEMVVVDLEIEPARGAGKMVQTLTLHRTGGISATPRN